MNLKVDEFHRGLNNWVGTFFVDGRHYIAYWDNELRAWMGVHQLKHDPDQIAEIDLVLSAGLKEWIAKIAKDKSEESEKLNNPPPQGKQGESK